MKYSHFIKDGDSLVLDGLVKGLGLRSLHFGLWMQGQPLTIEELHKAQEEYTIELVGMFPRGAETVLDVGAGIGDNAIYMARRGMKVTCVSPSLSQERYFEENVLPEFKSISFIRTIYEDLEIKNAFDVVLMSESCNFFPIEAGLDQTIRYLKSGGSLVVGAPLRKDHRKAFEEMHVHEQYVEKAKEKGLVPVQDVDVTDQVVQTMELAHSIYKYIPSITAALIGFYKSSFKRKHWIISKLAAMFFSEEIELAKDLFFEAGPRRTDPEQFLEHVTYRFMAFKKKQ